MGIDVFTNHNRIINHDSKNQDEGEEGHHVDTHIDPGHGNHGPGITDRNPHHDPECKGDFQKQGKGQEHQHKPIEQIFHQQIDPVLKNGGAVVENRSTDAFGQALLDFQQLLFYRQRHLSRGLLAHPINSDPLGGQSVVTVSQNRFLKPI